jgi:hypothetical protein
MSTRAAVQRGVTHFTSCPHSERCWRYLRIATGVAAWHSWQQVWNSIPDDNDDFTWH